MEQQKEHPRLVIECPNGIVIKIYQDLSADFVKEIIDEYMVWKKLFINKPEEKYAAEGKC